MYSKAQKRTVDNPPRTPMGPASVHRAAMLAKEAVFKAQDELTLAYVAENADRFGPTHILRRMEGRLARVRTELEALDRDYDDHRCKVEARIAQTMHEDMMHVDPKTIAEGAPCPGLAKRFKFGGGR